MVCIPSHRPQPTLDLRPGTVPTLVADVGRSVVLRPNHPLMRSPSMLGLQARVVGACDAADDSMASTALAARTSVLVPLLDHARAKARGEPGIKAIVPAYCRRPSGYRSAVEAR